MEHFFRDFNGVDIFDFAKDKVTHFYMYSQRVIEERIKELSSFPVIRYAQKALPNIAILKLMMEHGVVVDAVSAGELFRAVKVGYKGYSEEEDVPAGVVYTADVLDSEAIELIKQHRIPVNCGSTDMISQVAEECGKEIPIILRINPGFGHGHSSKVNTGGEASKHGIWYSELSEAVASVDKHGLELLGLHCHIGSGTDLAHLRKVAHSMAEFVRFVGPRVSIISAGGGIPVPYRPNEERINLSDFYQVWNEAKAELERELGCKLQLEVEPGRFLVAESGILVTKIKAIKRSGSLKYYLVDAGFDNLVRPAMYGAYHHISLCPAQGSSDLDVSRPLGEIVVAGPLCESGDVFTQEEGGVITSRLLPEAQIGDLLIIHTAGAYGSSMASQYNSRLLGAEWLVDRSGTTKLIRERQPLESTIQFERL